MKKTLLLTGALALLSLTPALAQQAFEGCAKLDARLSMVCRQQSDAPAAIRPTRALPASEGTVAVIVKTTDAARVQTVVEEAGYAATIITPTVVTVHVPLAFVQTLAALDEVSSLSAPEPGRSFVDLARADTGADRVHEGEELETPFTGKGVMLGVIDRGFEWNHLSFLDAEGNTRLHAYWDRHSSLNTTPKTTISKTLTGDRADSDGHATHVTTCAAGSKIEEHDFYGVAPEAELLLISSQYDPAEVLEDVKYIKEQAEAEGKPWVINMSFGSILGSHDGTDAQMQALDELVENGGVLCRAAGNSGGDKVHTSYTFTEDGESKYVLFTADPSSSEVYYEIWCDQNDGNEHLTIEPFVYTSDKQPDWLSQTVWKSLAYISSGIDASSGKQYYSFYVRVNDLISHTGDANAKLGVSVAGKQGDSFNLWLTGTLANSIEKPAGNAKYLASSADITLSNEACQRKAITVGAYNTRTEWTSISGGTYYYTTGNLRTKNAISYFSSRGPALTEGALKPTVCAPGAAIVGGLSSYSPGFDTSAATLVSVVTRGSKKYYYGIMQGTSMASPIVAGAVALWLQAYPSMKTEQVEEIIRTTARHDAYTKNDEWNATSGYGKLDVYEGLRKALELAKADGIDEVMNSQQPLTFSKGNGKWRLLFNNNESYARVNVVNTAGKVVRTMQMNHIERGDERTLDYSDLTPGVYFVQVQTTLSSTTHKVLVK